MTPLLKRALTAVLLMPVVLAALLWAPGWLFALLLTPFVALGLWEFLELAARRGAMPSRIPVYSMGLLLLWAGWWRADYLLPALVGSWLLLFTVELLQRTGLQEFLPSVASGYLGIVYVSLPLALSLVIRSSPRGEWLLLYLLVLVWTGDSTAYFAGRAFGRHKLAPTISPGKTVEGTVASMILTLAVGVWLFGLWFPETSRIHGLVLPVVINAVAQMGDLIESAIKRGAGVKDSSHLLPGHGGVLDRVDSLLFALPVLWYYGAFILQNQ